MSKILKEICNKIINELEYKKQQCSLSSLKKILPNEKNRDFKKLLEECQINKKNNIIAEIKKSSPSAGDIIKNYQPDEIAVQYEKCGAGAISILTEKFFFKGDLDHLSLINRKTNLPILRKDFIIDSYQIFESKVYKADAILLILSILDDKQVIEFIKIAKDVELDCIIEIHSQEELKRAVKINYPVIGINNRNLNTLKINTGNSLNLSKDLITNFTIVAESGIKKLEEIKNYNESGIYNFLIGESILRSNNIELKFKELLKNDNSS